MKQHISRVARDSARNTAQLIDRFLHEVSRYSTALLLLMVFCVETGVVIFVIRDLRAADREVQRIYAGSVLGLRGIGELQYQAQETRRSTLTPTSPGPPTVASPRASTTISLTPACNARSMWESVSSATGPPT
jgi:hypothetical protein